MLKITPRFGAPPPIPSAVIPSPLSVAAVRTSDRRSLVLSGRYSLVQPTLLVAAFPLLLPPPRVDEANFFGSVWILVAIGFIVQCDQMVRSFFNTWPLGTMKIIPIMYQICQSRLIILQIRNKLSTFCKRLVKFC